MKRTPDDRDRLRRVLRENEVARQEMQALLDRVAERARVRREARSWVERILDRQAAPR